MTQIENEDVKRENKLFFLSVDTNIIICINTRLHSRTCLHPGLPRHGTE